nr:hypothetical protein [Tanacetum cinerariifolium]
KEEDSMLYQKAKVEWLNEEDRNTSFFIRSVLKHFKEFLVKEDKVETMDGNMNIFDKKLFVEDSNEMIKKVSDKEVKEALIDIEDVKAPGPDGFTSKFFKE